MPRLAAMGQPRVCLQGAWWNDANENREGGKAPPSVSAAQPREVAGRRLVEVQEDDGRRGLCSQRQQPGSDHRSGGDGDRPQPQTVMGSRGPPRTQRGDEIALDGGPHGCRRRRRGCFEHLAHVGTQKRLGPSKVRRGNVRPLADPGRQRIRCFRAFDDAFERRLDHRSRAQLDRGARSRAQCGLKSLSTRVPRRAGATGRQVRSVHTAFQRCLQERQTRRRQLGTQPARIGMSG